MAITFTYTKTDGTQARLEVDNNTSHLDLSFEDIITIDLTHLKCLKEVRKISLCNNMIDFLDLDPIKYCTKLRILNLSKNELSEINLFPLSHCRRLYKIYIGDNSLHTIDLIHLSNLTDIVHISLDSNQLDDIDLSPLHQCDSLETIFLSKNNLRSIDLSPFSNTMGLKSVVLKNNMIDRIDLTPLRSWKRLRGIYLAGNRLNSIDLQPLDGNKMLQYLELNSNQLKEIDLTPLNYCESLEKLLLHDNDIKRIDVTPLFRLPRLRKKVTIDKDVVLETILDRETFAPSGIANYLGPDRFRYNAPVRLLNLDAVSHVYYVLRGMEMSVTEQRVSEKAVTFTYEEDAGVAPWKLLHVFHEAVRILDLDWMGMLDADVISLLGPILNTDSDKVKERSFRLLLPVLEEQIREEKTTIGLDIERMSAVSQELAKLADGVTEQRKRELEEVKVSEVDGRIDLRPLWLTAYGNQLLTSLSLGLTCTSQELQHVENAISELRTSLEIVQQGDVGLPTQMSQALKEYVWRIAAYNAKEQ